MSNNKKIIGAVAIVFIALVGYKFISSNIQENKEKAVLQERYRLEQQEEKHQKQDDIESCVEEAKSKLRLSTGSKCFNEIGDDAILSCAKKEVNAICKKYEYNTNLFTECLKGRLKYENKINEEFRQDKNECYKRY